MLASLFFYLQGTMPLENCAVMLVCSFMLFTALEAGGNYSALLRIIDIGVKKAQAILDVPMMKIDGESLPLAPASKLSSATPSTGVGSDPACGGKTCETGFERVSVKAVPEPPPRRGGSGKATLCNEGETSPYLISNSSLKICPILSRFVRK